MFRNIFIKKCGWLTKEELQKKPGRLGRLQRGRQAVLDTREDSKQVRGQLELGVGGLFHTHLAVQQAGSGHTEWWANKQMFSDSKCHVTSALFTRVSVCWCTCVCRVCCDLTKQALCSQLGGLVSTCGFILNLKIWTFNDLLLAAFWTLYLVDAYWMHFGEVTPTPPAGDSLLGETHVRGSEEEFPPGPQLWQRWASAAFPNVCLSNVSRLF